MERRRGYTVLSEVWVGDDGTLNSTTFRDLVEGTDLVEHAMVASRTSKWRMIWSEFVLQTLLPRG